MLDKPVQQVNYPEAPSRLKIDRSFVKDICNDRADNAVVTAMAYLVSNLDIEVIAEGVATKEQSTLLKACGCGITQGYLCQRPMPAAKLLDLIEDKHTRLYQPSPKWVSGRPAHRPF